MTYIIEWIAMYDPRRKDPAGFINTLCWFCFWNHIPYAVVMMMMFKRGQYTDTLNVETFI